jgi:hypothetical protein
MNCTFFISNFFVCFENEIKKNYYMNSTIYCFMLLIQHKKKREWEAIWNNFNYSCFVFFFLHQISYFLYIYILYLNEELKRGTRRSKPSVINYKNKTKKNNSKWKTLDKHNFRLASCNIQLRWCHLIEWNKIRMKKKELKICLESVWYWISKRIWWQNIQIVYI